MKKEKKAKATLEDAIIFRTSVNDKTNYIAKAVELGMSLSELIHSLLKNIKLPDRQNEKQLFEALSQLTREINAIGNNINQVTVAIHQIKNSQKMQLDEFEQFNFLLQQYLLKRDELRDVIYKAMFP